MHCAAITRISKNAAPARLVVWAIALRILRPSSMRMRAIADQVSSSSIDVDPPESDFPTQVILLRNVCSLRSRGGEGHSYDARLFGPQAGDWSHLAMIVCSCNVLSDDEVRTAARTVTRRTASSVYVGLRCRVRCGRCTGTIREIMDEELDQRK